MYRLLSTLYLELTTVPHNLLSSRTDGEEQSHGNRLHAKRLPHGRSACLRRRQGARVRRELREKDGRPLLSAFRTEEAARSMSPREGEGGRQDHRQAGKGYVRRVEGGDKALEESRTFPPRSWPSRDDMVQQGAGLRELVLLRLPVTPSLPSRETS